MILTKSQFMCYTRCPVELWLTKYTPNLLPEINPDLKRIFAMGNEVDFLAKKLYPDGVEISGYNLDGWENTQKVIAQGAKILFQPTAVANNLSARADILTAGIEPGTWDIREVKMTTEVKEEHVTDLAFQKICFEGAGIKIGRTYLIHINNQYRRKGEVDVEQLLISEDLTLEVGNAIEETRTKIADALQLLEDHKDFSEVLIQRCKDPIGCEFLGHGIKGHPDVYSMVEKLPKQYLLAMLQRELLDPMKLNPAVLKEIGYSAPEAFHEVDAKLIQEELLQLQYPLYFIDYETYGAAIPPFDGMRPYQQIPFQYALFIKETKNSEIKFVEFLARKFENPIAEFLASMKANIGPVGSVIVWNSGFEAGRNIEMAELMPEYKDFLLGMNDRMFDLMLIFKFKRKLYLHSEFKQSASLKMVLPVICPDLSYESLAIHDGGTASASWPALTDQTLPELLRQKLAEDMLAYCKRDSEAMVRILEHLEEKIEAKVSL